MGSMVRALRAGCVAAALTFGVLAPATVSAQSTAAAEADYPAFRATADTYHMFDMLDYIMGQSMSTDSEVQALVSPAQMPVLVKAFHQNMAARREAITDLMMRRLFSQFSHDDVRRIVAVSATPAGRRIGQALIDNIHGDSSGFESFSTDPDIQAMSPEDHEVMGRFLDASPDAFEAARDEVMAAAEAAVATAQASPKS